RPLRRLGRQRQRGHAHGARPGSADAGSVRVHRPDHVRLPRARDAVRRRRLRAVLLLRPAPLPPRAFPLHAGPDRGARLERARAAALGGTPAAPFGVSWPRSALLMCSSSSRTGPVEGLISLAREVRAEGVDARFAGDTVRPGENVGEHLAHAGVPWETQLRLSRKLRALDLW